VTSGTGAATGAAARPAIDGPNETVALRPDDFRLLSSDSRVQILKLLDARAMTGTELGKTLALEKSTVHGHLEKLAEGGLVARREDDRLWVYYELTPRGRRLLHPPRAGFTLLLSGSLISAGAGLAIAAAWVVGMASAPMREQASAPTAPENSPATDGRGDGDASGGAAADTEPTAGPAAEPMTMDDGFSLPVLPTVAAGLMLLAGALGAAAWTIRRK